MEELNPHFVTRLYIATYLSILPLVFTAHVSPIPIVVFLFQALTCSDNQLPLLFQLPTMGATHLFCTVSSDILHNLA